jgi:hypothetical protein
LSDLQVCLAGPAEVISPKAGFEALLVDEPSLRLSLSKELAASCARIRQDAAHEQVSSEPVAILTLVCQQALGRGQL